MEKYAVVNNDKALEGELAEILDKLNACDSGLLKLASDEVLALQTRADDIREKLEQEAK